MKIAIVRGPYLGPWELQSYQPLSERHDITFYTTYTNCFQVENNPNIKKLLSPDIFLVFCPPSIREIYNKINNRLLGWDHHLFCLEGKLKDKDIVHTVELFHTFNQQIINAKKKYGFKLVSTIWENIPFAFEKHSLRIKIKNEAKEHVDLFIAVSESAKMALITEGVKEEKIVVQPMGVDLERFKPGKKDEGLLKDFGITNEDFVVLFIGRLVWEKGIYELLYAAKKMLDDENLKNKVKFVFAGAGAEEKRLKKLISTLNLSGQVKLVGSITYDMMPQLHSIADVFVLPSIPTQYWREQFGFVLIEAMASGKAVISTLCGAIPEVVGDAGILVAPADHNALFCAIKKVFDSDKLRLELSQKARQRAEEKYNANKIASVIESYYSKLLDK